MAVYTNALKMKKINQEKNTKNSRVCPICGTRVSENASRCLVCGTQLSTTAEVKKGSGIKSRRLPEIRLSLPVTIVLGLIFLAIIGLLIFYIFLRPEQPTEIMATSGVTPTASPTKTLTPTITLTPTLLPTWTPLPPREYTVKEGDVCSGIAAAFDVSVLSIIQLNNLDANCTIGQGKVLMVPWPTAVPTAVPTATLATTAESDCKLERITVQEGWTLYSIALNWNVPMAAIQEYNKMTSNVVYEGMPLVIPLCEQKPTEGPTATPTPAPPYPAPNLLLPSSGAAFGANTDAITLQWASVADLRPNELYRVTIEDLTITGGKMIVEYVSDTKYILPSSFRPVDANPHIIQWSVTVARQINAGETNPIYEEAGYVSQKRVFSWIGTGLAPTATP